MTNANTMRFVKYSDKTVMKTIDDTSVIDLLECPKCKSKAVVTYGNNGEYIVKVV